MSLICKLKDHNWDGCRCTRCNETRDMMHRFEPMEGLCIKRCTRCGKAEEIPHTWDSEGCVKTCTVCGVTETNHKWKKHRCRICGAYDDKVQTLFDKPDAETYTAAFIKLIHELDQETLAELAIKAKDSHVNHEAWKKVYKPILLAKIKDETSNEYIRRQIADKFKCPKCGKTLSVEELEKCKCGSCGEAVHDFIEIEDVQHDGRLSEFGTRYKRCQRCGHTTKPTEYIHYKD